MGIDTTYGSFGGQAAPAQVTLQDARTYTDWLDWAHGRWQNQDQARAAAAAAAVASRTGQDQQSIQAAAELAAQSPQTAPTVDAGAQSYADWHRWAMANLNVDGRAAHAAADAAVQAMGRGGDQQQATDAARNAVPGGSGSAPGYVAPGFGGAFGGPAAGYAPDTGPAPANASRRGLFGGYRRGVRPVTHGALSIVYGAACLIVPFVFHFYFIVLPVFGIIYGIIALRRSRPVLGITGLVLNVLAGLLTLILAFG